jgi:isopenicillin-N epimerase
MAANSYQSYWSLNPQVTFLNHGSFGACPLPVLATQAKFREQLERQPLLFFNRQWEGLLDEARACLANFLSTDAEDLVFLPNATTGVNTVLRSLQFAPGDELLTTDQEYNACRNALDFVAEKSGAKIIVASIPFPITSADQVVEAVLNQVTERTKLLLISHITSQTALIFPVEKLVKVLSNQGIDTLIDGAHAVGMLDLNLPELGATYYAGNCHKWLCAPKGAGFLYVAKEKQALIRPLVISHGANSPRTDKSRFQLEFDWQGTVEPSAFLAVPSAIAFFQDLLPGGWSELREHNHQLVLQGKNLLQSILGATAVCPDEMIGAMAVIQLPPDTQLDNPRSFLAPLQDDLWYQFNIEVPIIYWPAKPQQLLRITAHIYNSLSDYEYLAESLQKLLI